MTGMKRLMLLLVWFIVSSGFWANTDAQPELDPQTLQPIFKWRVGEDLVYKVKWSFLTIGTLRFRVVEKTEINGYPVYRCRLHIDSNPDLLFLNIHDLYESYVGEDMFSHAFESWERRSDHILYTRYQMDYSKMKMHIFMQKWFPADTVTLVDSVLTLHTKVQEGISIFYYARAMAKHKGRLAIPVWAYLKFSNAKINLYGSTRQTSVRGETLNLYYLDGNLKFVGIAGLREGFKGWFSPDSQSVPLKSYLKAFIGNVKVEIERWRGWDARGVFTKPENLSIPWKEEPVASGKFLPFTKKGLKDWFFVPEPQSGF